ncbi:MAG: energy-coupling factor transporter ATPase [Phascolarctobacterium sp.]|nr:energy-coupling factor transporter ATPase [Phascolarctobacterium sp.]
MPIELKNVYHTYMPRTAFERCALKNISLTLRKGETVAVIGPTGSGKSTLMQHLNGLLAPDKGCVMVAGTDLAAKGDAAKKVRNSVGMVFQYPEQQIFSETVYDDIAFGPKNRGLTPEETDACVREAMAFVGLDFDAFSKRDPFRLSGGQVRRVAIAGIIAMDPDYLVLDEPSAGLDPASKEAILKEIMELREKKGIAIILVTHSMEEAARYAGRMLVISGGELLFDGEPAAIFREHKKELLEIGLDEPQVFKLSGILKSSGMDIPEGILSARDLVKEIKKAKGWK